MQCYAMLCNAMQCYAMQCNAMQGENASGKDLQQAFGTSDPLKVCEEILEKGDLQVSEQEREAMLERCVLCCAVLCYAMLCCAMLCCAMM
jgi:ribosome maturation protein Sdo1